jgi:Flp pilus assembly protein TadG
MTHTRRTVTARGTLARDQRGTALVELAVALPAFAIILVGVLDFGRVFRSAMVVTAAARAGALYGAFDLSRALDNSNITAAVNDVLASNNLTSGPSPTVTLLCECADNAGNYTATSPANTCTATCSGGGHMVTRLSVSVTRTFTVDSSLPGFPESITVTRTAIQRVQ